MSFRTKCGHPQGHPVIADLWKACLPAIFIISRAHQCCRPLASALTHCMCRSLPPPILCAHPGVVRCIISSMSGPVRTAQRLCPRQGRCFGRASWRPTSNGHSRRGGAGTTAPNSFPPCWSRGGGAPTRCLGCDPSHTMPLCVDRPFSHRRSFRPQSVPRPIGYGRGATTQITWQMHLALLGLARLACRGEESSVAVLVKKRPVLAGDRLLVGCRTMCAICVSPGTTTRASPSSMR